MAAEIRIIVSSQLQGGAIQQVNNDLREMDKTARDSSGGFSVLGGAAAAALGGVVVQAAGAAASAVGGFIKDSIGGAATFEAGMNQFAAAAGGSLDAAGLKVEDFQNLFLDLGAKLPVSTKEVEDAAIALVKGGIDPAILAAGGLESSLNFAAAAGMGLEDAANLSVKMLGTFTSVTDSAATKTQFLASAQDLLTKAANASTLDVDQLGNAMLAAGGQARAVGLDYQDFVTTMGLISPAFGSAAEAGTSFKNFLIRLNPTTKPAIDAMTQLGLYTEETGSKFYDAQGKFVGVEQASQMLKDSLSGLTDQQRVMALQQIFGNDAMGAAAALADGGSEAYRAFAEQMANANGVTQQAAAVNQGFDFAMTNLQGTIESVQIKLGTLLLPILTQVVSVANNLVNAVMGDKGAFDSLSPVLQSAVTFVQNLGNAFMEFATGFEDNGLADSISNFLINLGMIRTTAGPIGDTIGMIADLIMNNWQPILAAVGAIIGAVVIPSLVAFAVAMAPVIAAIGAGIAIGMALYNAWQSNFMGIQQLVTAAMTAIQALITQVLFAVQLFWRQNGEQIMAFAAYAWGAIQGIIGTIAAAILQLIVVVFGGIAKFFQTHGALIQEILRGAWQAISTIIQQALTIIQGITTTVLGVLKGNWGQAMEGIKMIISGLGIHLSAQMKYVLDTIVRAGPQLLSAAISIGKGIIDGMVSGITNGISSVAKAAMDAAKAAISAAMNALKSHSPSRVFMDIGYNTSLGMAQGIASGAPMVAGAAAGVSGAAIAAASNTVSSSTTRIVNYSPVYNQATNSPNSDRAIAAALAGV